MGNSAVIIQWLQEENLLHLSVWLHQVFKRYFFPLFSLSQVFGSYYKLRKGQLMEQALATHTQIVFANDIIRGGGTVSKHAANSTLSGKKLNVCLLI